MKKLLSVLLATVMLLTCIPLGAIPVFAEEKSSATPVYYTDLFYAYPYYLAEDEYLAEYAAAIEDVYNSVYESYKSSPLVIGTGLEAALDKITSPTAVAGLLTDAMGVTSFSYYDALDAANEEFLKNILATSSIYSAKEEIAVYGENCGRFQKGISILNNIGGEQIPGEPSNVEKLLADGFGLLYEAGVFNKISAIDVNAMYNALEKHGSSLKDCFSVAKTTNEIAEAVLYCMMLEDTRLSILDDIIATQTSNTVLKDGMTRLRRQMQGDFSSRFVNQFLVNHVADKVHGAINEMVETGFGMAQLNAVFNLTQFAFNQVVDVPKFADVLKWQVLMCYSRDLAAGLPNYALKFANGPLISNNIQKYENLFAAFDAVNNATLSVARNIQAMEDPFGDAFLVLTEAQRMGEETVTLKSGRLSVNIQSSMSSEEFYDIMRLGVCVDSTGITNSLGSNVSVSNSETTVEIPRKANTLFSIFRKGVSANMLMIDSFSYTDAYSGHIARVKSTIQSTPVSERIVISKDVYSKWTYTVNGLVQLRQGSDVVVSNSVYAVDGKILGNVNFTDSYDASTPGFVVDGNIQIGDVDIELFGSLDATGNLTLKEDTSLVIHGNVSATNVSGDWRTNLEVRGELLCNQLSGLANIEVFGSVCATETFDIPYWGNATLYGTVAANTFAYGYDSVVTMYGTIDCTDFNAGGIGTIYGDVTVHRNATIDHLLTVNRSGNLSVGNNVKVVLFGNFTNNGYVEIAGNFEPVYGNEIYNRGTLSIAGDIVIVETLIGSSPLVHMFNWGTIRVHNMSFNQGNSYYSAQSDGAFLYVSGDITWRAGTIGGTVVFNGTEKQMTNVWYYSNIILENESSEGVHFTYGYSDFRGLFDHRGNNFSTTSSKFIDYDGDGMKDNVDPNPTVGNPCCVRFESEDFSKGAVSSSVIETTGGTKITVTAWPTYKYEFLYWIDTSGTVVSTTANWELVARENVTYTAVFQKRSRPISGSVEGGSFVAPEKAEIESVVTVSVVEDAGYIYQEGSLAYNGTPIENNTFIMPDQSVKLTATFVRNNYYFALTEALAAAKSYTPEAYSKESFATLTRAISLAEDALYNHITEVESNAQIALLQAAIGELKEKYVVSVDVLNMPAFYVNVPDTISDLLLHITYDNGTTKDVSASECIVVGLDVTTVGAQTICLKYEGFEKETDIFVERRKLDDCTGFEPADVLFDGQLTEYTQSVLLTYPLTGEILVEGVDYTVAYRSHTVVGEATITIVGIGNYSGSLEDTYRIYCEHTYDNSNCNSQCSICGEKQVIGGHTYSADCDVRCDVCGFIRKVAPHTYNSDADLKCAACGMVKDSLISIGNFEDGQLHEWNVYQQTAIAEDASRTGIYGLRLNGDGGWGGLANHYVDTIPGRKYSLSFWVQANSGGANFQIRDTINGTTLFSTYYGKNHSTWTLVEMDFVATSEQTLIAFVGSGTGAEESVYIDDMWLSMPVLFGGPTSISEDVDGLAFRFDVSAADGQMENDNRYVSGSAQVLSSIDGAEYKLVRMGAVATNKPTESLDLESVDGERVVNIEAVYLCYLDAYSLSYAVRILDIPVQHKNTAIYVRPYYVYEKDNAEVVVYGDIVAKSYNDACGYNSDFESGDKSGWNCSSGTPTIVTDAHTGNYALKLENPVQWGTAASRDFEVKANTRYEVTWYAKRVSGTGSFNLYATQAESPWTNFTKISGQNWMSETSGEWVKYTCVYVTGENTTMQIKICAEVASAGSIIVDDIAIAEWYPAAISTFEDGTTDGWTHAYNALSVVRDENNSDNCCLMFDTTCADWSYAYKKILIDGNADCKISFKMKSNLTYPIIVRLMTAGWQDICDVQITPTTEWAEYTITLNPNQYSDVLLMLQPYVSSAAGQVFWFDDISYEPA